MTQHNQVATNLQYIPRESEERGKTIVSPHWPIALVQTPVKSPQSGDESRWRRTSQS